jgi:hypothetical protein
MAFLTRIHHSKYIPRHKFLAVELGALLDSAVVLLTFGKYSAKFKFYAAKRFYLTNMMRENARKAGLTIDGVPDHSERTMMM